MAAMVALIGVLGAVIGSFLNVVIHRLPAGQSVVRPRSHCPSCRTEITPRDNVPVLSWLFLLGRCRVCGARISARYPLIEALAAVGFAATALTVGVDSDLLWALPFVAMLLCVGAIDIDHHIVPNKILLPAAVYGLAVAGLSRFSELPELALAGAGAFALLLLAALIQPQGMGMGDVKLAGVMGLYLGVAVIPALLFAFIAGSLVGIVIVARGGMAKRKSGVPFAPFLAMGGVIATWWGVLLVDAYADRFL